MRYLKLYTDIALPKNCNIANFACVVRDSCRVVGFMHKKMSFVSDSKMAQLLCIKEALGWIKQF